MSNLKNIPITLAFLTLNPTHHSKEPSQRLQVLNKLENAQIVYILDNYLTQTQKTHA